MEKIELNKFALDVAQKAFQKKEFNIEESPMSIGQVNFLAVSKNGRRLKIKVRTSSKSNSNIFIEKTKFDIEDQDLYMAFLYLPDDDAKKAIYLIPATEWEKHVYPFRGKNYNRPGLKSKPEWGFSFSPKSKEALESYRFDKMIDDMI